ncbi:hypothetical protein AAC387_Pa02g3028 [Persea americana]
MGATQKYAFLYPNYIHGMECKHWIGLGRNSSNHVSINHSQSSTHENYGFQSQSNLDAVNMTNDVIQPVQISMSTDSSSASMILSEYSSI